MITAKKEVVIGLQHEKCYLVGEIKLLWGRNKNLVGDFSWRRGMSKDLASGECISSHPPSWENPGIV